MASSAILKLSCAVLVYMVMMVAATTPLHTANAAMNCSLVSQMLTPCIGFLKNGLGPTTACCNSVKTTLNTLATTVTDRRSASKCMQSAAIAFPGIDSNNTAAALLPIKCGVRLSGRSVRPQADSSRNQPLWPAIWHYVLGVTYNVNYCVANNCTTSANQSDEKFTIHGLWPNSRDSPSKPTSPGDTVLKYCDPSSQLQLSDVSAIQTELQSNWPNVQSAGQGLYFWNHEWTKHGTCSHFYPRKFTYFFWTLHLFDTLTPNNLLINYPPSDTNPYKVTDLQSQYQPNRPYVRCHNSFSPPLLLEIQFCYDDQAVTPLDCGMFYGEYDLTNCVGGEFILREA